ncbi:hypothetical protein ABZ079_23155 [Streptomyces sp. NPDC006314]|uniref:hypothetical protein n=1 Tax=Streptomyces sp. NPDC006314 TaxID=3154475 RepID=UPI0033AA73C7
MTGQIPQARSGPAWSPVRYLDYSFLRVDVEPAPKGHYAKPKVSGIAETGDGSEHFTVARKAKGPSPDRRPSAASGRGPAQAVLPSS